MRYSIAILLFSFLFTGFAFAQDESVDDNVETTDVFIETNLEEKNITLPDPGLTPDSPIYFLDDFFKSVRLTLNFNKERKAELRLQFAQEKLAEAEAMAASSNGEDNTKNIEKALTRYEEHVIRAEAKITELSEEKRERVAERVANATSRHLEVLDRVREKAPNQAKDALRRARDASENGHLQSIRAIAEERPEKAAELTAKALDRRARLAEKLADRKNIPEDNLTKEETERFERFAEFAEELKSKHKDATLEIKERIKLHFDKNSSHREATLRRVLEKAPDAARTGIERALNQSHRIDSPRELKDVQEHIEKRNEERTEIKEVRDGNRQEIRNKLRIKSENIDEQNNTSDNSAATEEGVRSIFPRQLDQRIKDFKVRDEARQDIRTNDNTRIRQDVKDGAIRTDIRTTDGVRAREETKDGEIKIEVKTTDERRQIEEKIQIGDTNSTDATITDVKKDADDVANTTTQ